MRAHPIQFGLLEFIDLGGLKETARKVDDAYLVARSAEDLGFERLWVGEHHGPVSPCSNPVIPIAALASELRSIRLGTAASLLRVRELPFLWEDFLSLTHLLGGRLDLGIGRGGLDPPGIEQFEHAGRNRIHQTDDLDELDARVRDLSWLMSKRSSTQRGLALPEFWLHGTGSSSAHLAGELRANYCHGLFLNGNIQTAIDAFKVAKPSCPAVGVAVQINNHANPTGAGPVTGFEINAQGSSRSIAHSLCRIIDALDPDLVVLSEAHSEGVARVDAFHEVRVEMQARGYWT